VNAGHPRLLPVVLTLWLLSGCSGATVTTKASSHIAQYHVRKIALIPFETMTTPQLVETTGSSFSVPSGARRSDMSVAVQPLTGQYARRTHVVPPAAGEKITDLVWAKLKHRSGLQLLSPRDAEGVVREPAQGTASDRAPAYKIAQRLSADAALSGKVLVYQERVGSRLGADPPAAVGFEVTLVASDGMVLWEGNYYEKQRPMIEDVWGFIRRRGMFVTAEELATYGAAELAEAFPFGTTTD
jgi:hypothetical protein